MLRSNCPGETKKILLQSSESCSQRLAAGHGGSDGNSPQCLTGCQAGTDHRVLFHSHNIAIKDKRTFWEPLVRLKASLIDRDLVTMINVKVLGNHPVLNIEDAEAFKIVGNRSIHNLTSNRIELWVRVDAHGNNQFSHGIAKRKKAEGPLVPRSTAARPTILFVLDNETINKRRLRRNSRIEE